MAHPEVSRIKSLARSYMWWPGLDADIEKIAKSCGTCQEHQRSPPKATLHIGHSQNVRGRDYISTLLVHSWGGGLLYCQMRTLNGSK